MRQAEQSMQSSNWMQDLFEELKRRRVFRVATLYVIAFWPIIQIADILSPTLGLPDTVIRYLVFAFIGGFPIMLILAWVFDINKDGITVTSSDATIQTQQENKPEIIGGSTELLVVGVLALLVIGLFIVQSKMGEAEQAIEVAEPVPVDIRSIAVLPFQSFSQRKEDQLFADGLTEELLTVFSHVKELRVAARTSSFAYKGVSRKVTEIGKELEVALILEGSVRRNDIDNTIRVTAQLIETEKGTHLWSQTYDRDYSDVFKIQDDIASSVVEELQITLRGKAQQKLQSRSSAKPEAMIANSMGQGELARRTEISFKDAERFFKKAIELDPNYSDAYVGVATARTLMVSYDYGASREENLVVAQENIDRAMAIDPDSGGAWAIQGLVHIERMQKEEALHALQRALQLNPSNAMAAMWYAELMETVEEKLVWFKKAYELDPISPVIGYNIADIMLEQGRDMEAMQIFARIVEADPFYPGAYIISARVNERRGRLDEAISQYERAYNLQPDAGYSSSLAELYIDLGDFNSAWKWIEITAEKLPERYQNELDWLKIQYYVANRNVPGAESLLALKLENAREDTATRDDYLEAAWAAYLLGKHDEVITAYAHMRDKQPTDMHARSENSYVEATLAAAYVYKTMGDELHQDQLLDELTTLLAALQNERAYLNPEIWYQQALLSVLQDDSQMALIHMQRAVDEGWRQHWRPGVEPILFELNQQKNFIAMMAGLETRMEIMREQLALASAFDSDWSG
jgi:TolB-like protein/Flp pilus assembly protein TadD